MFRNPGGKIKSYAKVLFWIGVVISIIIGVIEIGSSFVAAAYSYQGSFGTILLGILGGILTVAIGTLISWLAVLTLHIDVECSIHYTVYWEVQLELSTYIGDYALRCFEPSQQATYFTIPQDAKLHDSFIVLCAVKSISHIPMTRYVQIRIQVISTDVDTADNNPLKGIGY